MRYISLVALALFVAVVIFFVTHELPKLEKQEKDTDKLKSMLGKTEDENSSTD